MRTPARWRSTRWRDLHFLYTREMAKRGRPRTHRLTATAETIGAGLGHLAAKYDLWVKQRDELAEELRAYVAAAESLLVKLGHTAERAVTNAVTTGRRAAFKISAEAKRKMSEAAKPHWATKKGDVVKKKRTVSPEVRAKLARLAKARWAKAKKAGKTSLGSR